MKTKNTTEQPSLTPVKELVANDDSKGVIIDYTGLVSGSDGNKFGILAERNPIFDPRKALDVIRNDPTVKAAIITKVDKVMEAGFHLEAEDGRSRIKKAEQTLKDLRFSKILRQALFNYFLYNNAYIEIVKKGDTPLSLNVLETTFTRIKSLDNGDVIEYFQLAPIQQGTGNPNWGPDSIVHLKLNSITSAVYADTDIQTLYDTILIKDFIRQWMSWFFGTNQMRPVYAFKTKLTPQKVQEFVSGIKATERDLKRPLIFEGEGVFGPLMSFAKEGASVQAILSWCDMQILELLQVPPIAIGMADSTGRSNSVEQYSGLNTHIRAIHQSLEDTFTYDMLPKLGFEKVNFKFGTLDFQTTERLMNMVQVMKNAMFTDDAIEEVLCRNGMFFESEEVFKDPVEEAEDMAKAQAAGDMTNKDVGTGNEGMIGNKSADAAPSRQRQNDASVSDANKKELVKNSIEPDEKFSKFPYIINSDE